MKQILGALAVLTMAGMTIWVGVAQPKSEVEPGTYTAGANHPRTIRTEVYGSVAPGHIYTTMINMNAYLDSMPVTTSYKVELNERGELVEAQEVGPEVTYIDYIKHEENLFSVGRFPSNLHVKDGVWELRNAAGEVIDELEVADNPNTDDHGLVRLQNGNFVLPSYKLHTLENGTEVESFVIEEVTPEGEVVFVWDSLDYIPLSESDFEETRPHWLETGMNDYIHGNRIAEANDGNLLVSGRHINQIINIDRQTGDVLWQLGGKNSDFTFIDDPYNGFSHQHSVSQLPNGNILLYDNGNQHNPPQTRVVEYKLDLERMTATLVWEYKIPGRFTFATGSVQRTPESHTIIGWGMELPMTSTKPRITELDEHGDVVMEIFFPDDVGFYSAYKL